MNEHRRGSIFWPVLLILAGVLLLLDQLGVIAVSVTAVLRLWPLLLVLIGLDLLLRGQRVTLVVQALLALLVVAGALALSWASLTTSERGLETRNLAFPADGVTTATVVLDIGAGTVELYALPAADQLVQATVTHRPGSSEATLEGDVAGGSATVTLRSKSHNLWLPFGRDELESWRIGLNPNIPLHLLLDAGVGRAQLDLRGLQVEGVELDGGVGEYHVVLAEWGRYEVRIEGGIGTITVTVPEEVEALLRVDEGLGSFTISERFRRDGRLYVTPGYDEARDRVDVDIDGGIGTIVVE